MGTERNTNFYNLLMYSFLNYKYRLPGEGKNILAVSVFQQSFF